MKSVVTIRAQFLVAMVLAALCIMVGAASAQTQPSARGPEAPKVEQFLELLRDPDVRAWLESRPEVPGDSADTSFAAHLASWEALLRSRIAGLGAAVSRLPSEFEQAATVVTRDVNAGSPGKGLAILMLLIGLGYLAEWGFRRVARSRGLLDDDNPVSEQRSAVATRLLLAIASLLVFSTVSIGLFVVFEWPPLLRKIVLVYLFAFILFRLFLVFGKLGEANGDALATSSATSIDTIGEGKRPFWNGRLKLAAGYLLFTWATASLLPEIGFSPDAVRLITYVFGIGLLVMAFEAVWTYPFANTGNARLKRGLLMLALLLLLPLWILGMYGLLWLGIFALTLPRILNAIGNTADRFAGRYSKDTTAGALLGVLIVRGVRMLVIAAAVGWLAMIWRLSPVALANDAVVARVVAGLLNGVIILLVADLVWNMAKVYIERRLDSAGTAGAETPEVAARRSRLRTLLPIFRNTLGVFILVVTVLTILSGLGVEIAPLIAGAGIFGVAIGFGSQTLVKDVLSGVFYMLDDAFRVGEYIQSGSYKGTVESFSLRSVKLRHQRGPIYTVPFGDLGAVQNMSRDWVVEKMMIGVTYDSDIELARKLIKKIGLELAQDPEFAASTLQPLKMQGVDNFGEFAVDLRLKLMTKPGEQFGIKRRALVMIKKAFEENGIKIAVPTVQVSGGGGEDVAAAANETRRRRKAAAAAPV